MKIVIVGAGGHARVVYEIMRLDRNLDIVAFVDNVVHGRDEHIMGVPVLGDHSVLPRLIEDGVKGAIVAVGDNQIRASRFQELADLGLLPLSAIHPTSHIAASARIGAGVTIAMGAIVSTGATIGNNVIVNTGAIVEHEDNLEDHVHIGPRCALAGRVTVKRGAFIGIGAVVKEYTTVGRNSVIGAGSVVLEDIPDNVVAVGCPANVIKTRREDDKQ